MAVGGRILHITMDYGDPRGSVIQVEFEKDGVVEVWKLVGECNRCGKCCEKPMSIPEFRNEHGGCKHLKFEKKNGERVACCKIMWGRPAFCMLYPRDPYEMLDEECSYSWERVS